MSVERQKPLREVPPLTETTRKIETNRYRRIQQFDIALLRMKGIDRVFEELSERYSETYPDMNFRIIRPLILPEDIESNKMPNPELRASFNLFFNFGDPRSGRSKDTDYIGRGCSRSGLMVIRNETRTPVALEVFGRTSEVITLESVSKELLIDSLSHAVRNPLDDVEPRLDDLDKVRPRIIDVNPYSKIFVKHF